MSQTERQIWQVERDRFGVMYSGPLEVGEMIEVVPATWDGVLAILDRYYPADVFTGESGDPGTKLVAAIREVRARKHDKEEQAKPSQAKPSDGRDKITGG